MDENRPDLTITVLRTDGPLEIKMTYGMEMDLRRVMPDPATAMQLAMVDADTQDYIIRRCLTPSKKIIRRSDELIDVEEVDIDTEDGDALIMWVLEHQLHFFAKRATGLMDIAARQKAKVPSSLTSPGSENLDSTTQSAGPSESSKETSTDSSGDTPDES